MKTRRRIVPITFAVTLVGAALLALMWSFHQVSSVVVHAQSGACPQGPLTQAGGTWHTYYCTQFNSLNSSEDVPPVAGNNGRWFTGAACADPVWANIVYDGSIGSNVLNMGAFSSHCYSYIWRDDDETGSGSGGSHPQGGTFPVRTGGRDGVRMRMRLRPVSPAPPNTFCNTAGYGVNGSTYYWPGYNPNLVLSMFGLYGQTNGPSRWYRQMSGGYSQSQNFSCSSPPGYVDLLLTGLEAAGGGAPTWTYQISSDGGATWQTIWTHTGEIGWPLAPPSETRPCRPGQGSGRRSTSTFSRPSTGRRPPPRRRRRPHPTSRPTPATRRARRSTSPAWAAPALTGAGRARLPSTPTARPTLTPHWIPPGGPPGVPSFAVTATRC